MSAILGMLLAGGITIIVAGGTFTDDTDGSQNAGVSINFATDGGVYLETSQISNSKISDWIIPNSAAPGNYEIRATLQSGSLTSGTTGSWLALTSSRSWSVEATIGNRQQAELLIEIRDGNGTVWDSGTYNLDADARS